MNATSRRAAPAVPHLHKPKLGFVGAGWIGRLRMQALLEQRCADFSTVFDPSSEAAAEAAAISPGTAIARSFEDLLHSDADAVVIATPSAMHAEQCIAALRAGKAVFCQKPLARTLSETQEVLAAAKAADKLLAVDFSYRHLAGVARMQQLIVGGELGEIFSADLTFHNAYGPDKPWFYDMQSAGGGCVMDLGIHLVDLASWLLGGGEVSQVHSTLFHKGQVLASPAQEVEDYAVASYRLGQTHIQLNCSWNLHAGQDAVIEADFYGTRGSVCIRNVGGSFFDFEVYRFSGTGREMLAGYPDAWGGRALTAWAEQLAKSSAYDPEVESVVQVAQVIDRIYCR